MRIVVFSDSLGRPRPDLDDLNKTRYKDVYGYILKNYMQGRHEVELCYVESLDSEDAVFWGQRMVAFREPDLVIFHFGINDAAPRLFKKNSKNIILNQWFRKLTKDIFMRILNKYRYFFTRLFPKTYISLPDFRKNIQQIMEEITKYSPNADFYAVSICRVPEFLETRSWQYNQNINNYNSILGELFGTNFIDINQLVKPEKLLIRDGIHLTAFAHGILAAYLCEKIKREYEQSQ
jgi:lysophospholipase L1-like esterase